jgi:hypothetical protein
VAAAGPQKGRDSLRPRAVILCIGLVRRPYAATYR